MGIVTTAIDEQTTGKTELAGPSFSAGFASGLSCTWAATKVKSTFNTDGSAIKIMTTSAKFNLVTVGVPQCPKAGVTLDASWALTAMSPSAGQVPVGLG